jgi:hypothetical protein
VGDGSYSLPNNHVLSRDILGLALWYFCVDSGRVQRCRNSQNNTGSTELRVEARLDSYRVLHTRRAMLNNKWMHSKWQVDVSR